MFLWFGRLSNHATDWMIATSVVYICICNVKDLPSLKHSHTLCLLLTKCICNLYSTVHNKHSNQRLMNISILDSDKKKVSWLFMMTPVIYIHPSTIRFTRDFVQFANKLWILSNISFLEKSVDSQLCTRFSKFTVHDEYIWTRQHNHLQQITTNYTKNLNNGHQSALLSESVYENYLVVITKMQQTNGIHNQKVFSTHLLYLVNS